jgi:hypothetical protein
MPVTKPKGPSPAARFPPATAQNAPAAASKKKKKKKGKGKAGDGSVPSNHPYREEHDLQDEDEDEIPIENDKHRRVLESEFEGRPRPLTRLLDALCSLRARSTHVYNCHRTGRTLGCSKRAL